jgi:hypothetical protein
MDDFLNSGLTTWTKTPALVLWRACQELPQRDTSCLGNDARRDAFLALVRERIFFKACAELWGMPPAIYPLAVWLRAACCASSSQRLLSS